MITNKRVFADDHVPRELQHRTGEVETLSTAFKPAIRGRPAGDVLISGPSGVGKTVLARHTVRKLRKHAHVADTHIHSLGMSTTGILREVVKNHPRAPPVAENTPREDLEALAEEIIDQPYIVILDEADDLPSKNALDVLGDLEYVSVVVVCHDEERWLARVDDSTRSRLAVHLHPDRYSTDELVDILKPRAERGLVAGAVDRDQLEEIADGAAGVARRGIQSLRSAAELAAERGHSTITDADVQDSFARAEQRIRESNLQSLGYHHQVLYELVREEGSLLASDLHERYDQMSDRLYYGQAMSPIGRRARRYKLEKLDEYKLIETVDDGPEPVYRVVDASLPSPLDVDVVNV